MADLTYGELLQLAAEQEEELLRLQAEAARLAAETRRLRRYHASQRGDRRRIQLAYDDCLLLLAHAAAGLPTSKRQGPLSVRRWQAAIALLRAARLWEGGKWAQLPAEACLQRLEGTCKRTLEQPVLWRMRLGGYEQVGTGGRQNSAQPEERGSFVAPYQAGEEARVWAG